MSDFSRARRRAVLLAVAGLALGLPAAAHDYKAGDLAIDHPWARATPAGARVAGGYMTLRNTGAAADRLVAVESDVAGRMEIHEMAMDGTITRMRELARGLPVPAGGQVELKPGGYHVMFMELKRPLVKDDKVKATLVFERAGRVEVEFQVEAMGSGAPAHRH
ncbi:MAG: copper chaperone PCu(A)C [Alphaproteobacteria bacterium]|nr:copper chaperone PCu(A)C [Alphaproteobacteria bacterium]